MGVHGAQADISGVTSGQRLTPLSSRVLRHAEEIMATSISHGCFERVWCTHTAHGEF